MKKSYETERLLLAELDLPDALFIKELVNTEGWIRFIGQRNVNTDDDAVAYVQKIMSNSNINYWVARLRQTSIPVGVISFIKRDYLEHCDIGFAFLPQHQGNGYAFEAATVVLEDALSQHSTVLATTLPANNSSILLLEKLGFGLSKKIEVNEEALMLYAISV